MPEKYKVPKYLTVTSMIVEYAKYFSMDPDVVADKINQMDYYALKVLLAQQYASQLYIHLKYYSPKK